MIKSILSSFILIILFGCSTTIFAQAKTWLGPDGNWSDETKWAPEGVPNIFSDVIIPSGTTLDIAINAQCNSITVNAGATMDISANLQLADNSIFAAGSIVDLVTGLISFNNGVTLTVTGMLNVTSEFDKGLYGGGILEVTTPGSINFDNLGGSFSLGNAADLKISPTGVMNIDGDLNFIGGGFSIACALINEGVINKTSGIGTTNVSVSYESTNGTLNVESGTLNFDGSSTIHGETCNVTESSNLIWSGFAKIIEGELMGVLDGPLTMDSEIRIMDGETASFNFTGSSQVDWLDVQRNMPGILYNYSTIHINGPSNISGTTMINHGIMNLNAENGLQFTNTNAVLENQADGIININVGTTIFSTFGPANIFNSGLIKSQMDATICQISPNVTNDATGVIDLGNDSIWFNSAYNGTGVMRGDGTFAFTNSSSVFAGHLYPGDAIGGISHGSTTHLTTSAETVYHLDIEGTTPETEHDVFHIQNGVNLNGTFDITLGFLAQLDDEFLVMTFNDTLSTDLPETVELLYEGNTLVFDVIITNTDVTLKVVDIILGLDDLDISFPNLSIGPNPSTGQIFIEFGELIQEGIVEVYDINGSLISSTMIQALDRTTLNFEGSAGNYMMRFESKGKQAFFHLVKE